MAGDDLAAALIRTRIRIALGTGPDELVDILAKPFAAKETPSTPPAAHCLPVQIQLGPPG
jgi:hypothetical protein